MTTTTTTPTTKGRSEPRADKVAIVEEITAKLNNSVAVFVSEYRGLSVGKLANLRTPLREAGAEHKVYKNTLARLAATNAGFEGLNQYLLGPTALTFVTGDSVAAAKALVDQSKANPFLVIKGGKVEYRTDRYGNVHVPIGKTSFELPALYSNLKALIDEVERAKPATAKGKDFRKITVSSTMGPGVKVDPNLINETD